MQTLEKLREKWPLRASGVGILALLAMAAPACTRKSGSPAAEGKVLFQTACARCHGEGGTGGLPLYDGGPSPRNFCDHAFHKGRIDGEIKQTIINGKGTGMPAFGNTFNDAQLDTLVAYVRSLDPGEAR